MKRVVAALAGAAALALYSAPAEAQDWEYMGTGLSLGVNFPRLDNGGETDSNPGLAAGLFLSFEVVPDQFYFQPEMLFTMKGGEEDGIETRLMYLECQGLFKYTFLLTAEVQPMLLGGLSLGYNIWDDVAGDPARTDLDAKFYELAVVLGLGTEFDVGTGTMSVDLRFSIGLTDVPDKGAERNEVTSLMVGYRF